MRVLRAAVWYVSLVFGVGFVLGTVRVLLLVPRVGARLAELLESPLMLLATVLAARWITRHCSMRSRSTASLGIGLTALLLLLAVESGLGVALRGGGRPSRSSSTKIRSPGRSTTPCSVCSP